MARANSLPSARSALKGSETPRVFTPSLRDLDETSSLGFECIRFAEDVLGLGLYPWQRWLLIHALELLPDGTFRFRKVFVLVGRQNGKSTLLQVLSLWRMYLDGAPLVLGTAQDRGLARDQWLGAVEIAQGVNDLAMEIAEGSPVTSRGFEQFVLNSGEQYKIAASNRRAGRGLAVDLLLMDELREHQSWDAWAAVSKTTNARPKGQVWAVSNAGDAASIVLRHFRKVAHADIGDPDKLNVDPATGETTVSVIPDDVDDTDESLGIFEWSAKPGCSVWDRSGWAQSNPSLGYGALTERTLASDAKNDPEWVMRTEVLCQWSDGSLEGPFPPGAWEAGIDKGSQIVGDVVACVDVSVDRGTSFIAFAGKRPDGLPHVEIVAQRAGTDWVKDWLTNPKRVDLIGAVTGQHRGAPVSSMLPDLVEAGLNVVEWSGSDLTGGTGAFYDLVRGNGLKHLPQPVLDIAAATAIPKVTEGGAFMWDRKKSPNDVAPLIAATGAVWLLNRPVELTVSAYADHDLIVI